MHKNILIITTILSSLALSNTALGYVGETKTTKGGTTLTSTTDDNSAGTFSTGSSDNDLHGTASQTDTTFIIKSSGGQGGTFDK